METSLAHMTKVNRTQRYECVRARFLSIKMGKRRITCLCGYASVSTKKGKDRMRPSAQPFL